MNKFKKAFSDIVDNGVEITYFNEQAEKGEENNFLVVSEALDKETPMKPLNIRREWLVENSGVILDVGNCKKCGYELLELQKYCSKCGQKTDWSEDDE